MDKIPNSSWNKCLKSKKKTEMGWWLLRLWMIPIRGSDGMEFLRQRKSILRTPIRGQLLHFNASFTMSYFIGACVLCDPVTSTHTQCSRWTTGLDWTQWNVPMKNEYNQIEWNDCHRLLLQFCFWNRETVVKTIVYLLAATVGCVDDWMALIGIPYYSHIVPAYMWRPITVSLLHMS